MQRSSFICKGGGRSRDSVWQSLLAKLEAGGQRLRLLLLPLLVLFGLLLGSAGAWAADVTTNVTTVAVTPATPAPGGTATVTFTLNAAAVVGDTITYTNSGTAVAADFNPSGLPSGTFTVTTAGGSQVMTLTLSGTATIGNTVNVTSNAISGTAATITASSAGIAITAPASVTEGAATADFPITITETLDGTHAVTCTRTDAASNVTNLVATPSSIATGETATAISVNTSTAVAGDTIACTIAAGGTDTITGSPASVVVTAGSGSTITITAPATIAVGDTTATFTYDVAGAATTAATTVACTLTGGTATPTPATIATGAAIATGTTISVALTPAVATGNTVSCTLTNAGTDTVAGSPASATEGTVTPPPTGTAPDIHLLVSDGNPPDLFPNPATPPSTTRCVDFGYVSATENVIRQFAVGNISLSTAPSLVASTVFQPSPDLAFQQQNAANLGGITLNTTTVPTTAPAGVGYFEVAFNASLLSPQPASLPMVINRTLVVSSNDPDTAAGTIYVPLVATVIPSKLPKVQVADSTTAVPPAGTDISNGTPTAVQFTPSAVSSGTTVTRNFSIKNGGYEMLAIAPTTATFTPDASTTAGVFTINPFADEANASNTDTSSVTISPPPPQGCNTSGNTQDYSKMNITFTAPTVTKQTTFGGTVCLKSNDNLTTTTATVDFCFPVTATVYPPPPLNPEIDVYDGTTHIPNLDTTGIDFGSTAVGSPVQRKITIKNPSAVDLTVFDFSSNLPTGFSLLNANYASKIPSGGSTNLIFQCDATAAGSFGAAQTSCASNPLGAGCSLRVPSNDGDNVTWEFNGTRPAENPYTLPMKCVVTGGTTANVPLNLTQPASGVVVSDSGGISCGTGSTTCMADYPPSTAVKLTATADTGATFTSWGGDCGTGTTSPLTVTMDAAKNCTATFTTSVQITKFPLNITTPSKGVVASDTGGINCGTGGTVCTGDFTASTLVKLTATADAGATFTGWGGDCAGTASPLDVMMDKAKTCTATFEAVVVTTDVTLTITPPTEGNIMSSTGGINCGTAGTACTATYSKGDTVQLVAAGTGKMLDAWGGDCAGNNNPLSVTMDANKTCSATFTTGSGTVTQITLTITSPVGGSITSSAGGINCGTSGSICVANYAPNASVQLTAIPDSGKIFTSWGGACTGTTATTTVTMDAAKSCTATFTTSGGGTTPPPPPSNQQLTVTKVGTGTITSDVGGINCGLICSASYTSGSIVRLTASGGTFSGWSGSCGGTSATTVVTMDAAKNCTATFSGGTTDPGTTDPNVTSCFSQGGIFANGACLTASNLQPGAVDASGTPISVTVSMKGGLSNNGAPYLKESTVVLADTIATRGVIQVDPADVGKKVDIIVAGIHTDKMYPRGFEWYMLDGCNTCVRVLPTTSPGRDAVPILSELAALKTVDALPSTLVVDMYSGHFVFPGFLDIFYGYRVVGSGKVVFNADPIKVTINP